MVLLKALGPHSKLSLIHNDYRPGRISSFECTQKRGLDSRWQEACCSGTTTAGVERLDAIPASGGDCRLLGIYIVRTNNQIGKYLTSAILL